MNEPEGTGSDREKDPGEGIVLPSWIDAAISRTQGPDADAPQPEPRERSEELAEPATHEPPTEEYVRPSTPAEPPAGSEPFPTFLDRRDSMAYENQRVAEDEPARDAPEPIPGLFEPAPAAPSSPPDFLARRTVDEFDAQREEIVSQALAEDAAPHPEPIPLPVAPPRKRAPSGPWLMAAIFFAAAALVLAILIWLKPLP